MIPRSNQYAVFEVLIPTIPDFGMKYLGEVESFSLGAAYMLAHLRYPESVSVEVQEVIKPWTGIENLDANRRTQWITNIGLSREMNSRR